MKVGDLVRFKYEPSPIFYAQPVGTIFKAHRASGKIGRITEYYENDTKGFCATVWLSINGDCFRCYDRHLTPVKEEILEQGRLELEGAQ